MWCLKKRWKGAKDDAEAAPLRARAGKNRRNSVGPAPRRFSVKAQALKQLLGQTLI